MIFEYTFALTSLPAKYVEEEDVITVFCWYSAHQCKTALKPAALASRSFDLCFFPWLDAAKPDDAGDKSLITFTSVSGLDLEEGSPSVDVSNKNGNVRRADEVQRMKGNLEGPKSRRVNERN